MSNPSPSDESVSMCLFSSKWSEIRVGRGDFMSQFCCFPNTYGKIISFIILLTYLQATFLPCLPCMTIVRLKLGNMSKCFPIKVHILSCLLFYYQLSLGTWQLPSHSDAFGESVHLQLNVRSKICPQMHSCLRLLQCVCLSVFLIAHVLPGTVGALAGWYGTNSTNSKLRTPDSSLTLWEPLASI